MNSPNILRSITNEAGRQADFYNRKSGTETECQFWSELESLAGEARRRSAVLVIEMRERVPLPIPIKPCEQGQQLPNHNVIKAFR